MKTITMDFEEYETIMGERNKANELVMQYCRDMETVFGAEKAKNLHQEAESIRESKNRMALINAVRKGEI